MRMSMKPPPPRLPAAGQVTAIASAVATAASTALPPFFMMSTPTCDAIPLVEATMPWRATTGSRIADRAVVVVRRTTIAISFRMTGSVLGLAKAGGTPALQLRPVVGVDGDVVVAEVGGENDGGCGAAAEVEDDGDAFAGEDFGGVFFFVNRGLAVRHELNVGGEERHAFHVEARAAAAEGGQDAAPVRIAAVEGGFHERRRCDGVRGQLGVAVRFCSADGQLHHACCAFAIANDHPGEVAA